MRVRDVCTPHVRVAYRDQTLAAAAQVMRAHHVGALVVTLGADQRLTEAVAVLNERAVRRAPVLDASGALCGIVTLNDLLPAVARQLEDLASLMGSQAGRGGQDGGR